MSTLLEQSVMPHKPILPLCICGDLLCRIPYGYCHCACGERTRFAIQTKPSVGQIKGMPLRFIMGHNGRKRPVLEDAQPFKIQDVYCRLISLSRGMFAIVNASDYEWLMQWKWYAAKNKT